MFKLAQSNAFWWPAIIKVPKDGGTFANAQIKVKFEPVSTEEATEIFRMENSDDVLLRRTVRDLDDIQDEDGNQIPFSDELLERMIAFPPARMAMAKAYVEAMNGEKARRKN